VIDRDLGSAGVRGCKLIEAAAGMRVWQVSTG
jgi:hypothetical protein